MPGLDHARSPVSRLGDGAHAPRVRVVVTDGELAAAVLERLDRLDRRTRRTARAVRRLGADVTDARASLAHLRDRLGQHDAEISEAKAVAVRARKLARERGELDGRLVKKLGLIGAGLAAVGAALAKLVATLKGGGRL